MNPEQALATRAQRTTQLQNKQQLDRLTSLEKTFVSSMRQLVQFLDGKTTKTEVLNQLKDYASNKDINKVVSALEQLGKNVSDSKLDITPLTKGLNALEEQLKKLPTEYPEYEGVEEVTVKNQIDIKPLEKAIRSLELKAPDVNVSAPDVKVDTPDLKPLQDSLLDVVKAIKSIPEPPATDMSNVEKKLDKSNKYLEEISKIRPGSGGGSGVSYQNSSGTQVRATLESDGSVPVTIKNPDDIGGGSGGDGHVVLAGTEADQKDDANYGEGVTSGIASVHPRVWNGTSYDRWIGMAKPTDAYDLIQDDDTSSASYEYYGFMKADGGWFIKRITLSNNLREYVKGSSGYTTAWTNRASQTFADYGTTF